MGKFVEERFVIRPLCRERRVVGHHDEVAAGVARPRAFGSWATVISPVATMLDLRAGGLDQFFCWQKNGAGCRCIPILMHLIVGGFGPTT